MARNASPSQPPRTDKPVRRNPGARVAQTSLADRFESWRLHHRASARDALRRMRASPLGSLMTVTVIAIALALPAGMSVMLENLQSLTRNWDGSVHLSVFLETGTGPDRQQVLADQWQARDDVSRIRLITADDALEEFRQLSGFGEVLDALPDNPLPPLIMVFPRDTGVLALENLKQTLRQEEGVDLVQLDVEWVQRLQAMIAFGQRLVAALALALALAVVLVMVNTIRLAIENRRDEIVVVKTVGGTDAFVRRPFLYTGFWHGFMGGLLSVVLVQVALWWLDHPFGELMGLYESEYSLTYMGFAAGLLLPLHAGLLGLIGAWLAVSRHLKDIDPQIL